MWDIIRTSAAAKFGYRNAGAIVGGTLALKLLAVAAVVGGMLWVARQVEAHAGDAWAWVSDSWPNIAMVAGAAVVLWLVYRVWRFFVL